MHRTRKCITQNSGEWNRAISYVFLLSERPGAHCRQTDGDCTREEGALEENVISFPAARSGV